MSNIFFCHQPVVSKQGHLIANRLTLHVPSGTENGAIAAVNALRDVEEYWPMEDHSAVFLNISGSPLEPGIFDWMFPENATLEVASADISTPDCFDLVDAIRKNQPTICLDYDVQSPGSLEAGLSFRFAGLDSRIMTPMQMQSVAFKVKPLAPMALALNVDALPVFKECVDVGLAGATGWFCKHMVATQSKKLAPAQAHIVRVLNLVRNNADVAQIEAELKHDVALSYRLLRYINSVGFGLSCEVQSFRHAVTILGYQKLNKWLSLLLVSSGNDPMAPVMMHASLVRARFMELIGEGLVRKDELDNLFIVGAFSMLDVMLGVSLENAIEPMHLPADVVSVLLSHDGPYMPYYAMAIAAEDGDAEKLAGIAAELGLVAKDVNAALLQALSFATSLSN